MDGRYPLRKGCIGNILHLKCGSVMVFEYTKDNQGNEKQGYLRTSTVADYFDDNDNKIDVYTMNSIYHLKKVED